MVNLYEGIKKIFNKNNKKYKLQKDDKKNYFVKSDTLGGLDFQEVNELAERLISWYKIKIPDRLFVDDGNKVYLDKNNVNYETYKKMTFNDFVIKNSNARLLNCEYKSNDFLNNKSLILNIYTVKGMFNNKIDKVCNILVDKFSGKILGIDGEFLFPKNLKENYTNYTIDEMLGLMKKNHVENLNFNALKTCVNNRNKNIRTRDKIIERVCSKLMFNGIEENEYGYYRAVAFIKDINTFLGLNLDILYLERIKEKEESEKVAKKIK